MTYRRLPLALAGVLLVAFVGAPTGAVQRGGGPARGPGVLVVRDVTLVDGTGAAPRAHTSLVIRDGRIADIVVAGREPAEGTVVDGAGRFAIPGLFDGHVHVTGGTHADAVDELGRALRGGVTTVWDLAGDARMASELAREAAAGEIQSPTIYFVALMAGPAFFTDPRVLGASRGFEPGEAPWAQAITSSTDIARAVTIARGTGAVALKLYAALDGDVAGRIIAEAKRQGLKTVAHATVFPGKPGELVAAGVDVLAHAPYLVWEGSPPTSDFTKRASGDFAGVPADSPVIEHLLEAMRDRGVAFNPTLWIFAARLAQEPISTARTAWSYAVTKRAAALGIPILAGTDALTDPRLDVLPIIHRELEQLVNGAGLTPAQAIISATKNVAQALGAQATRGTLEVGKAGDVVVLDANPLDDITNTRKIHTVIKDGQVVERR
ncbi:MAG TPA: amidohydrolase family protein [Vicinamibacterales bacterium]|nr:amidohydrolase family protein [Vicinamibacterales bacterium]